MELPRADGRTNPASARQPSQQDFHDAVHRSPMGSSASDPGSVVIGQVRCGEQRRTNMRTQNAVAVIATVAALSIPTAQAQLDRPVAPPALSQPLKPCPPSVGNNAASNESNTLSDQLSQSKGVICPPAGIDPGISVPPSGGGRTPVIPPPGTPGGD